MKKILIYIVFCLYIYLPSAFGQIEEKKELARKFDHEIEIPTIVLPPIDLKRLEREDKKSSGSRTKPFRFAEVIEIDLDPQSNGKWIIETNGDKRWYLRIKSDGAFSLGLLFDHYRLPVGAELYIYNSDQSHTRGAFTYKNNKPDYLLAIAPIQGDEIVLEYYEPLNVSFSGELQISSVAHDYKNVFNFLNSKVGYGTSGLCNVNVNCESDTLWQLLKHSVCKISYNGYLCSGALINNTENNGNPYFLTAYHCIDNPFKASSAIFYFNYESPTCINQNGSIDQTISGSTILATPSFLSLDFSLLKLSVKPPSNYFPYYAGWNRNEADPVSVTSIHHPNGDIKKITKSLDGATTNDYGDGYTEFSHWWIDKWELGTTEVGSSGSPLFDEKGRIVGDLSGGDAHCAYNYNDYYQKLNRSWNEFPETNKQLKAWLDPKNKGVLAIDGYLPFDTVPSYLYATVSDTVINLKWNRPINYLNVEKYFIYRDSVKLDSTVNTFYKDIKAYRDSVYLYWVKAKWKVPAKTESAKTNHVFIRTMNPLVIPFSENFESGNVIPSKWYEERTKSTVGWEFKKGGLSGLLDTAFEGNVNAYFYDSFGESSKLVLPRFDLSSNSNVLLSFYVHMQELSNNVHELRVLIKEADSLNWQVVRSFKSNIPTWEKKSILLPNINANYQIALEGIGLRGAGICIDSLKIREISSVITPNISVNKNTICVDDSVEFSTSISDLYLLEWDFGKNAIPQEALGKGPHKVKYLASGSQGVSLKVDDTFILNIYDKVAVYGCPNPIISMNGNVLKSSFNYGNQWFYNGIAISGAVNQTYSIDKDGDYYVQVTNSYQCVGSSEELSLLVSDNDDLIPKEVSEDLVNIYPNPNTGVFTVSIKNDLLKQDKYFKIYDITGKEIQSGKIDSFETTKIVNMRNSVTGIYLLKVYSDDIQITLKLLIKK